MQDIQTPEATTEEVQLPNAYDVDMQRTQDIQYARDWLYIFASLFYQFLVTGWQLVTIAFFLLWYVVLLVWHHILVPFAYGALDGAVWLYTEWLKPLYRAIRGIVWK